jgi:hypothetical protein
VRALARGSRSKGAQGVEVNYRPLGLSPEPRKDSNPEDFLKPEAFLQKPKSIVLEKTPLIKSNKISKTENIRPLITPTLKVKILFLFLKILYYQIQEKLLRFFPQIKRL